jgi:adenylate cyclase
MELNQAKRRLAAILVADVAGYTRLVEEDTEGTVVAWKVARDDVIHPIVSGRAGKIVKFTGDGFLAEFPSVEDAVAAAIEAQEALANGPLSFRMGVNLGDVTDDGQDIHGEGVNIAARLEALADIGTINVSGMVYEAIRNRIDAVFEDLGEHAVKNVSSPVRIYRVAVLSSSRAAVNASTTLPLPDKPSIAVLPFTNLSGGPEHELIADGMAEDIITGLSRFRWLFVIARNSSFTYKGQTIDVPQVASEMGVRYVLEGSVRMSGQRIRVTGQLIDAKSGGHLWAQRYDRDVADIFEVQDEVTDAIVAAIGPEVDEAERARAQRSAPESLDAWLKYQQGLAAYYSTTDDGLRTALRVFDELTEMDATFAPAFAMAADARCRMVLHSVGLLGAQGAVSSDEPQRESMLLGALAKAQKGLEIDQRDPLVLWACARVKTLLGEHAEAITLAQQATMLNPNDAKVHHALAFALHWGGEYEEAVRSAERAIRLSPQDAYMSGFQTVRAVALFKLDRFSESVDAARRATNSPSPRNMSFAILAAALRRAGEDTAAEGALGSLMARAPKISIKQLKMTHAAAFGFESLYEVWRELGIPTE